MFNIDATDEEITKKKKRTLLGLFILLFLVAGLAAFVTTNEAVPPEVALTNEDLTPTAALQPTATPTTSPTAIPTVTPTSTPQPTATATSLPPTPTAVPPTVTPTSTATSAVDLTKQTGVNEAGANEFTPGAQVSGEGASEGGEAITEGTAEETATETSGVAGEQGSESATKIAEESFAEAGTSGSVETGSEQPSQATPEVVSPETLPTTGIDGFSWGMTWLALGIILVLIGFGVTSASNINSIRRN